MTAQHKPAEQGRGEVGEDVARQVLDDWMRAQNGTMVNKYWSRAQLDAMRTALTAAIAALTQPKSNTVGHRPYDLGRQLYIAATHGTDNGWETLSSAARQSWMDKATADVSLPRQSEAVATIVPHPDDNTQPGVQWHRKDFPIGTKLYTTPPAQVDTTAGDGMVLVPREPTEAMVLAALAARNERIKANAESNKGKYRIGGTAPGDTMIGTYRAMIQAATAQDGMK